MKFLTILTLLFLVSCGSSSKKDSTKSGSTDELAGITNDDFKPKRPVRYNQSADYHIIRDLVNDALKDETLAKVDVGEVKKLSGDLHGVVKLCYLGNVKEARIKLDQLYAKYKKNASYWNQVGSCFFREGKFRKAKIYYNKAISLKANYIPALNNLGVIYLVERKDQKALAAFKQALKLRRNAKTVKYNLANLYIKYGLFSKAIGILNSIPSARVDKDITLAKAYVDLYTNKPREALRKLVSLKGDVLRQSSFSLALLYAYKQTNNKKWKNVADFLKGEKLNSGQRSVLNRILSL